MQLKCVKVRVMVVVLAGFMALASATAAENITLAVGFVAGGTSWNLAFLLSQAAKEPSLVVQTMPGNGGSIAAQWVARQRGGSALLLMSSTSLLNVDLDSGLLPVALVARFRYVVVVRKDASGTLDEYMTKAAKSDPEAKDPLRTVATAGDIPHLIAAQIFKSRDVPMFNLFSKGSAVAIQDVIAGNASMAVVPFPDFVRAQSALKVIAETGNGIETSGWIGVFAPPGTHASDIGRLAMMFRDTTIDLEPEMRKDGFSRQWATPAALELMYTEDYRRLKPLADLLGIRPSR